MHNRFHGMRRLFTLLTIFYSTLAFGQGYIDLSSNTDVTPWRPDGALLQTFNNIGTPQVTVTATVQGNTNRLRNQTPRNDSRGLWLNIALGNRTEGISVTFTFSEPVTNLSFGILGIDRELSFSNYQDRVLIAGYDDNNVGVTPAISYNPNFAFLTNGVEPFVRILSGFNSDPLDSTRSTVTFPGTGVKKVTIAFNSGDNIRNGATTAQSIFLTDLSWASIVPVELIYFRGKAENDRVRLNWATANESNSDYFQVERSTDLKEFTSIGRISSKGDSKQRVEYSFLDEAPLPGVNYYRLKQVDKDRASEYSKIIAVSPQTASSRFIIYPNPSDGQNIKLQFDNLELDGLRLSTLLGQEIPFEIQASNTNSLTIKPLRELQTGLYFITYADAMGRGRLTQKLWVNK
jgi:hypothetical protein